MLSPYYHQVTSLFTAVTVVVAVILIGIASTSTNTASFVIGMELPVQHQRQQQQQEVAIMGSCSFTNPWTGPSCMEFHGKGWTVDLMTDRCAIETESTLTVDAAADAADDDVGAATYVGCSASWEFVAGYCVKSVTEEDTSPSSNNARMEATLMLVTAVASSEEDNSNAAECDTTVMACETFVGGIFEYGPACQTQEPEDVDSTSNKNDNSADGGGGGRPSSSSSSVRDTNTVCDTSPEALTKSLVSNILTTAATMNNTNNNHKSYSRVVDHTCIDSTGYVGQRCFYTYIPECATNRTVPLVYDIHGVSLCPLWNFETTGWIQKSIENCFVVVWPLGNIDPNLSSLSCFALEGGYNVTDAANNHNNANDKHDDNDDGNDSTDTDTDTDTAIPGIEYQTDNCCCFNFGPNAENPPSLFDDTTFLRNVATVIVQDIVPDRTNGTVAIDTQRIYFGGHSNGCTAGLAMAASHSDLVSAVCCHSPALISPFPDAAAVSSSDASVSNYSEYSYYTPVPIFLVHGKLDGTVQYYGDFPDGTGIGNYNPGAEQMNSMLGTVNNCSTTSRVDGMDMTSSSTVFEQKDCNGNTSVTLLSLDHAGHTPFLQADLFMGDKEGAVITTVDTTQHAWEFCSGYTKEIAPILELITTSTTTTATATSEEQEDDDNNSSVTSSTSTSNSTDTTSVAEQEDQSNTNLASATSATKPMVFSWILFCVVPTFLYFGWNY